MKEDNEEEKESGDKEKENEEEESVSTTHYLVKWRSLQYEDSTWELDKDVDSDKIEAYYRRCAISQQGKTVSLSPYTASKKP